MELSHLQPADILCWLFTLLYQVGHVDTSLIERYPLFLEKNNLFLQATVLFIA